MSERFNLKDVAASLFTPRTPMNGGLQRGGTAGREQAAPTRPAAPSPIPAPTPIQAPTPVKAVDPVRVQPVVSALAPVAEAPVRAPVAPAQPRQESQPAKREQSATPRTAPVPSAQPADTRATPARQPVEAAPALKPVTAPPRAPNLQKAPEAPAHGVKAQPQKGPKAAVGTAGDAPVEGGSNAKGKASREGMEAILTRMGVKPSHILIALRRHEQTREPLPQIMRDFGFLSGEQVAEAVSQQTGREYFAASRIDAIDKKTIADISLPEFTNFAPVGRDVDGRLLMAIPDTSVINLAENTFYDERLRFVIASEHTIQTVYRKYFANTEKAFDEAVLNFMKSVESGRRKDEDDFSAGYVRDVFFALLRHICYAGASDLYLFKSEYMGIVKLKVNGVGTLFRTLDTALYDRLLNKLVQENSKAEELRKRPKESVLLFTDDDKKKFSDITNRFGFRLELTESRGIRGAVIRILDKNSSATELDKLGFDPKTFSTIARVARTSVGFFLVTGPTGSGKTTSLYAILKSIDPVERSVQSIENPIEYKHGLWQQYEVRKDATDEGEEYNAWLKALLRNAPDVILVGEVRDREVANICLSAANTGHLVFATLHTNNAALAVARLKALQVDMDVLGSVLLGILAQRLLRTLCKDCSVPDDSDDTHRAVSEPYLRNVTQNLRKAGRGCPNCDYTGYRGRQMLYELLEITPETRQAIEKNESPSHIAKLGLTDDATMWASGLRLICDGKTSLEELQRVASKDR